MTLITVEGVYRKGNIQLLEALTAAPEGRVLVTFLGESQPVPDPRPMQFGQFAGPNMSTEEDFKIAEWQGEEEFDAD
jgi:hypothetical protein